MGPVSRDAPARNLVPLNEEANLGGKGAMATGQQAYCRYERFG